MGTRKHSLLDNLEALFIIAGIIGLMMVVALGVSLKLLFQPKDWRAARNVSA
jgi:hypothetical protein